MQITLATWRIGKLDVTLERERYFYWMPYFTGHIQRDTFLQNYSNYYWYASIGWLWWSVEVIHA